MHKLNMRDLLPCAGVNVVLPYAGVSVVLPCAGVKFVCCPTRA